MKHQIYVASSWRNRRQPEVVKALRQDGHMVYDFRNPPGGGGGFQWREIDENWQSWTPAEYLTALRHPIAQKSFRVDMEHLNTCHSCLLVMPCGVSAHLELGWACGMKKSTAVLLDEGEPELMRKMADRLVLTLEEALQWARDSRQEIGL